jgi:hypothetical protein
LRQPCKSSIDGVPIVDPQLAAIICDNAKPVMARPEYSQAAFSSTSKVVSHHAPPRTKMFRNARSRQPCKASLLIV